MLNTAHQAITTRLQLWADFFATGNDASPTGATDDEYGLDQLIDLARDTESPALHALADKLEIAGQAYLAATNRRMFNVLMQDEAPTPQAAPSNAAPAVSLEELEAALIG